MTIIADSAYLGNDRSKLANNTYRKLDAGFSGVVIYSTPKGQFMSSWGYKNGHLLPASGSGLSGQNQSGVRTNEVGQAPANNNCFSYYYCIWDADGYCIYAEYLYTLCNNDIPTNGPPTGGGGTSPHPCQPTVSDTTNAVSKLKINAHDVTQDPGTDPDPGDGGPPPPVVTCPPVVAVVDTTKKAIDTCAEKAKVIATQSNAIVSTLNTQVLNLTTSTGFEYAAPLNLSGLSSTDTYVPTTYTTQSDSTSVNAPFSWVPGNYTIGLTHGHKDVVGPSPDDVFKMITNLLTDPNLLNASAADKAFYKANAYVNALNSVFSYQIIITDWNGIMTEYNKWIIDPGVYDASFKAAGKGQGSDSEYAMLTTLGSYVNLFRANAGTTNYQPWILTPSPTLPNVKYANPKPCPH